MRSICRSMRIPFEKLPTLQSVQLVKNRCSFDNATQMPPNIAERIIDCSAYSPVQVTELLGQGRNGELTLPRVSAWGVSLDGKKLMQLFEARVSSLESNGSSAGVNGDTRAPRVQGKRSYWAVECRLNSASANHSLNHCALLTYWPTLEHQTRTDNRPTI